MTTTPTPTTPIERVSTSRAMWSGAITFGVVSAPVKLYSAVEESAPKLHQVCKLHSSGMRQRRWCVDGDHEVDLHDVGRGIKNGDEWALVDAPASEPAPRELRVTEFVPAESVPLSYFQRTYYIAPDKSGRRPYDLLVAALDRTGTVGVVRMAIREKQSLALLRTETGRLVLTVLYWPEELRTTAGLPNLSGESQVSEPEVAMACTLIRKTARKRFDASSYVNEQADALRAAVDKAAPVGPAQPAIAVIDLMSALKASMPEPKARKAAS